MSILTPVQTASGNLKEKKEGAQIVGSQTTADCNGPGPNLMEAETLTGDAVVNYASENLGTIKSIMLDVEQGKIAYAVLAVGGFLNLGARLFAIPWNALKLDKYRKVFILNANKDLLEKAPGFDQDNWPKMSDLQWANKTHQYYGIQPYWYR